jgi:hypothetical protein
MNQNIDGWWLLNEHFHDTFRIKLIKTITYYEFGKIKTFKSALQGTVAERQTTTDVRKFLLPS